MANSIVFKIMNQEMMDALVKRGDVRLPKKKVSIPKDKRWNTKKMNAKLIKGLENGDSIRKIMKSLEDVIGDNRASQERNARTMVTEAENHGRFDSYKKLEQDGVVMKKEWIATPDDRTRASHVDLDGEEQDIDKPFSNGCMYPADGDGPPEEVWNCRCSMGSHIIGFKRSDGTVSKVNYEQDRTTHEKQMEEEKQRRNNMVAKATHTVVQGKDISATWKRRSDQFDFEIEDVINAQGFDGLPRVVDAEEFDRYVQESNFIAQRTYSAPDQETLDAYQMTLYEGKWYVDCSTGGAAYGQGMYCAGNYEGKLTDEIKKEMLDYQKQNLNYSGVQSVHAVETFTFDKSAKIIDYNDLEKMQLREGNKFWAIGKTIKQSGLSDEELAYVWSDYRAEMSHSSDIFSYEQLKKIDNIATELDKLSVDDWYKGYDKAIDKLDLSGVDELVRQGKVLKEMNIGSYAVVKGYDAIRTDHGTSGADTIILNRTKLIIKDGRKK